LFNQVSYQIRWETFANAAITARRLINRVWERRGMEWGLLVVKASGTMLSEVLRIQQNKNIDVLS